MDGSDQVKKKDVWQAKNQLREEIQVIMREEFYMGSNNATITAELI